MLTESVGRKAYPRRGAGWEHEVSCGALASACRSPGGRLIASYRYGCGKWRVFATLPQT
uniref:Uncharacterized protein n=1 Tax=Magnetococcus massalia (strain MO-1) TaxID=451514 RepID=A0A1S7LF78_MAGMO|nr:protein of unknown function [Candidatus Magnetococcus massalia]